MYEIVEIEETCGGCPSQWEGKTSDGKDVYIRFRWGYLRVDIDGETIASWQDDDGYRGVMDLSEALEHLKSHIFLSPAAMKKYYVGE